LKEGAGLLLRVAIAIASASSIAGGFSQNVGFFAFSAATT
jgi:hypothetical protein